ncbi:MAG: dephospho-CoA kinase [Acidimicrobiales bacterium]
MLTIGLTGNIGAGKSTVAQLLVAHGAALVDADRVAREVVEPGAVAYQPLIDRFGTGILDAEGRIDRPALAAVAFGNPDELTALNDIIHPAIGIAMIQGKDAYQGTDRIVVMDIPLLKVFHRDMLSLDAVIVVDIPPELALERITTLRGMSEEDARARQAAQPTRAERLEGAEYVVDNSDDADHLAREVDRVWAELARLPQPAPPAVLPEHTSTSEDGET